MFSKAWSMAHLHLHQVVSQLRSDADNPAIDDATFRRRALRLANRLRQAAGFRATDYRAFPGARTGTPGRLSRAAPSELSRRAADQRPRYRFIAVPNGAGGMTSVSIRIDRFENLSRRLGGAKEVMRLSRELALGHRPDSGVTRSRYVLMRLLRKADSVMRRSEVAAKPSRGVHRTGIL